MAKGVPNLQFGSVFHIYSACQTVSSALLFDLLTIHLKEAIHKETIIK